MNIIPAPKKVCGIVGTFAVEKDSKIFCDAEFVDLARYFSQLVFESSGIELDFSEEIEGANIIFKRNDGVGPEGYIVMISQGIATISFSSFNGCFYAIQTLRQLFNLDLENESLCCDNCYIEDEPKFKYRGLLIDICRHFFSTDTLKEIIDLMSQVKLNVLHLHLSDDQGFRFQIDKYPLLNKIGSTRGGSEVLSGGKRYIDETPVEGFLSKKDVADLVAYAKERNIEIVPELDIPGHFVAALSAYPEYSCLGSPIEVRKKWGISKDILCAGNENTYKFICDILDEICEMFPCELIHLGGDEAPKDRWCNCKLCREKLAELKLSNFDELQTYMTEYFRKYLEEKGKTVICWNDGVTQSASDKIISQVWKPLTRNYGVQQANKGRKTIMSPFFNLYFDYPYAMTPLNKTYKFNPLRGIRRDSVKNIVGVEGALWTEHIATEEKLFFNLLPRLDALGECAWGYHRKDFAKRVKIRCAVYDKRKLPYNASATKSTHRNPSVTRKFFKYDSNIEINGNK